VVYPITDVLAESIAECRMFIMCPVLNHGMKGCKEGLQSSPKVDQNEGYVMQSTEMLTCSCTLLKWFKFMQLTRTFPAHSTVSVISTNVSLVCPTIHPYKKCESAVRVGRVTSGENHVWYIRSLMSLLNL
jgi:hypothetical protein